MCPDDERLEEILSPLSIKSGDIILDVGCGTGRLIPHIKKHAIQEGIICGLDYSINMLSIARHKFPQGKIWFINSYAEQLPFRNHSFDKIICFAVFPHIDHKAHAVSEFFRILKQDGILVIFHLSSRDELNEFHRNVNSVVSNHILPDKQEIQAMLANTGFTNIKIIDIPSFNYIECMKYIE
jgi:ubiquinone/menaquinone biosynthesis C-methylase UbiE